MKKSFSAIATSLVLSSSLFVSVGVSAAETLYMSSWLPNNHPMVKDIIEPWIAAVDEVSNGELNIVILPDALDVPAAHFDIARRGAADITYGVHAYQPTRFLLTQVAEMPYLGESAEQVSVNYWRVYNKYFASADEHEGTELLGLATHGSGMLFSAIPQPTNLGQLSGLPLRSASGVVASVAMAMTGQNVVAPSVLTADLIEEGSVVGTLLPMSTVQSLSLSKVLPYATHIPGGMFNTSFFLVVNQEAFDDLTAKNRLALRKVSGVHFARLAGQAWDQADAKARQAYVAAGGSFYRVDPEFIVGISSRLRTVESNWAKQVSLLGFNGKAALHELRRAAAPNE